MRKGLSLLLLFLGALLLCAGLVSLLWAQDAARVTPEEIDNTTYLSGSADKLNPATGEIESIDVKVTSVTKSDTEKTDEDVIAWVNTACVVIDDGGDTPDCVDADDPEGRLVSASTDVFATDRVTAEAVNDPQYLPDDAAGEHEGLVNKFPFDTKQQTYQYWDGLLGRAVDAEFVGEDEIDGLDVYTFQVTLDEEPAEVVEGVDGLYSSDKTIWVEPQTGAIVDQEQREVRTLENGDLLLDLSVSFTDDQVATSVEDSKGDVRLLWLLSTVVPLVGIIGGVVLLALGVFLLLRARRGGEEDDDYRRTPVGAHRA